MDKIGFSKEINLIVRLLYINTLAKVKINGSLFESFFIKREIWQRYPLALYLFFVVVEAVNSMIFKEVELRTIKRIQLLMRHRQQIMVQYANNTSLILFGKEENVKHTAFILDTFCLGSNSIINWLKLNSH